MFPSIDNKMGIESVKKILLNRDDDTPPAECIIEALQLFLNCNNLIFNNQHYWQVDGTAQGRICPFHTVMLQYTTTIFELRTGWKLLEAFSC